MNAKQREIFLVPFPFSDLRGSKIRPVLVLSKDNFNLSSEDVIVCSITSNNSKDFYSVLLNNSLLEEGHLFEESTIKVENIVKIEKNKLLKKIAKINNDTFSDFLNKMFALFR